jgi:hypothetical protein
MELPLRISARPPSKVGMHNLRPAMLSWVMGPAAIFCKLNKYYKNYTKIEAVRSITYCDFPKCGNKPTVTVVGFAEKTWKLMV